MSSFSSKEKSCFICFCRLHVVLQHERNFVNKQPGSTISTSINGSRSCYITTKRFAFLSVGTKLARTIDISNNNLNWFWALFKKVNPWPSDKKKEFVWSSEKILRTWHTDPHCEHWKSLLPRDWKVFLCTQSLTKHFVIRQHTSPMRIIVLMSYPQSGVKALHIVIALHFFSLVCNVISVLVEMVNFTMVKLDSFCKNKLIAV